MSSSDTEIANLALAHLGSSKDISDLETERSAEANACRRFYSICRDAVLGDFPWPFATKNANLALIEEFTDNDAEWEFSYAYPSDCARFNKILSGTRTDNKDTAVPFEVRRGASGQVIYTDMEDAVAEYVILETDTARFSAQFVIALSYKLASMIAPRITGGDPFKLGDKAALNYAHAIAGAQASATNENQPDLPPESEFTRARDS